jgi:hypothetical protein
MYCVGFVVDCLSVDCFVVDCLPVDCLTVETKHPVESFVVDCHIQIRETDLVVDCQMGNKSSGGVL